MLNVQILAYLGLGYKDDFLYFLKSNHINKILWFENLFFFLYFFLMYNLNFLIF